MGFLDIKDNLGGSGFWGFMADPMNALVGFGPVVNSLTRDIVGSDLQRTVTPAAAGLAGSAFGPWGTAAGLGIGTAAAEGASAAAKKKKVDQSKMYRDAATRATIGGLAHYALAGNEGSNIGSLFRSGNAGGLTGAEIQPSGSAELATVPESSYWNDTSGLVDYSGEAGYPVGQQTSTAPATGGGPTTAPQTKSPMASRWMGMDDRTLAMMGLGMGFNLAGAQLQADATKDAARDYRNAVSWTPERTSAYLANTGSIIDATYAGEEARRRAQMVKDLAGAGRGGGSVGQALERLNRQRLQESARAKAAALTTTAMPPNYPLGAFPATSPLGETFRGAGGTAGQLATLNMMYPWLMSIYPQGRTA